MALVVRGSGSFAEHDRGLPGSPSMPSPMDVVRNARPGRSVVGWKLDPAQRAELLEQFRPRYAEVVADHVTLAARVAGDTALPHEVAARAVGHADDGLGVEALVVEIGGTTDRPGGSTYHITWSLGPGRRAVQSNDVIAAQPWQPLKKPVPLTLIPARFP